MNSEQKLDAIQSILLSICFIVVIGYFYGCSTHYNNTRKEIELKKLEMGCK